VPSGKVKGVQT